jgi:hypothetical protein
MSWPQDGKPRYIVATVTGFCEEQGGGGADEQTVFYVLDRGNCHHAVKRFFLGYPRVTRFARAAEHAAMLNAQC